MEKFGSGIRNKKPGSASLKLSTHLCHRLVEELNREAEGKRWGVENYPHLHTPLSASIVLQWVLRHAAVHLGI
jgi:hypothetical protein